MEDISMILTPNWSLHEPTIDPLQSLDLIGSIDLGVCVKLDILIRTRSNDTIMLSFLGGFSPKVNIHI